MPKHITKEKKRQGMVVHVFSPSYKGDENKRFEIQSQPRKVSETLSQKQAGCGGT
jgi:hypothetical protein